VSDKPATGSTDWFHPWLTLFNGWNGHEGSHYGKGKFVDCPATVKHHHCDPKCSGWPSLKGMVAPQEIKPLQSVATVKGPLYKSQVAQNKLAEAAKHEQNPLPAMITCVKCGMKYPYDNLHFCSGALTSGSLKFQQGGVIKASDFNTQPLPPAAKPKAPDDALAEKIYEIATKHGASDFSPFAAKEIAQELDAIANERAKKLTGEHVVTKPIYHTGLQPTTQAFKFTVALSLSDDSAYIKHIVKSNLHEWCEKNNSAIVSTTKIETYADLPQQCCHIKVYAKVVPLSEFSG
jgi:hypothetical protein